MILFLVSCVLQPIDHTASDAICASCAANASRRSAAPTIPSPPPKNHRGDSFVVSLAPMDGSKNIGAVKAVNKTPVPAGLSAIGGRQTGDDEG